MSNTRTIKVEALSRVEGEGGLFVRLKGDVIEDVELRIFEPPRLFEALLRGRSLEEVPDITARICGICPVAYQMSSVHALEAALGIVISPEIRRLRRLLYCGEWIESHALHVHLLHAPDFLGYDSGIDMARDHPQQVNRGLRLKKHGNQLLEVLGGRAIHPINVAVGGFYKAPRRDEFSALVRDFEWGLEAAVETTRWVAGFDFPDFNRPYEMVAVVHPDEYAMNEGRVTSSSGQSWSADQYESAFAEQHVPHSTALQSVRKPQGTNYLVGPLARLNLSRERLSPRARQLADELKIELPCLNPFKAIIARGLELVHAYDEALDIIRTYQPPQPPRVAYGYRAGEGCAATEAPRGLLYHRYLVDDAGHVTFATIIPPTSQNQRQIEEDLREYLPQILKGDDVATALGCERLVRSYDPCISCSTHFLKVTWERR
ncbi:MAG TPA: Ni/Fe hydrogenase subunit alpha [Planctomycetaceae bacterium]|jgi:coenzyme F420-reducing hydrogenase alpha subunit